MQFLFILLMSFSLLLGCAGPDRNSQLVKPIKDTDSIEHTQEISMDSFINRINYPSLELPYVSHFVSASSADTLVYEVLGDESNYRFRLFLKNQPQNSINLGKASSFEEYEEGDIDGDGGVEIGVLEGYPTSACRVYKIYSFKKKRWKLLYSIPTHLPDRAQGVDYIKKEQNIIRKIGANINDCCQCLNLDTVYIKSN